MPTSAPPPMVSPNTAAARAAAARAYALSSSTGKSGKKGTDKRKTFAGDDGAPNGGQPVNGGAAASVPVSSSGAAFVENVVAEAAVSLLGTSRLRPRSQSTGRDSPAVPIPAPASGLLSVPASGSVPSSAPASNPTAAQVPAPTIAAAPAATGRGFDILANVASDAAAKEEQHQQGLGQEGPTSHGFRVGNSSAAVSTSAMAPGPVPARHSIGGEARASSAEAGTRPPPAWTARGPVGFNLPDEEDMSEYAKFVRSLVINPVLGPDDDLASLVSRGVSQTDDEDDDGGSYQLQSEDEEEEEEEEELVGVLGKAGVSGRTSSRSGQDADEPGEEKCDKGDSAAPQSLNLFSEGATTPVPADPDLNLMAEIEAELSMLMEEDMEAAVSTLLGSSGAASTAVVPSPARMAAGTSAKKGRVLPSKGGAGPPIKVGSAAVMAPNPPIPPSKGGPGPRLVKSISTPGGFAGLRQSVQESCEAAASKLLSTPKASTQLPTSAQIIELRNLMSSHYQLLLQQGVLAVRAANLQRNNKDTGNVFRGGRQKKESSLNTVSAAAALLTAKQGGVPKKDPEKREQPSLEPSEFFFAGESGDDLAEILDGAVGMLQDLDENRKDGLRNAIQLQVTRRLHNQRAGVTQAQKGATLSMSVPQSAMHSSDDNDDEIPESRRLTRSAFQQTLKARDGGEAGTIHAQESNQSWSHDPGLPISTCFDVRGLSKLDASFAAIDSSVDAAASRRQYSAVSAAKLLAKMQGDDHNILEPPDNGDACELLLRQAGANYAKEMIPGWVDPSQHLSYPQELLGEDFEFPMSKPLQILLRKNRNHFTSAEDNLILRGVNLYGEKEWLLISDRFLPDRSVSTISQRYSRLCLLIYRAQGVKIDANGNLQVPPKYPNGIDDFNSDSIKQLAAVEPPARFNVHRWSLDEDVTLLKAVPLMGFMWAEIGNRLINHRDRGHLRKRYQVLERRVKATVKREKKMPVEKLQEPKTKVSAKSNSTKRTVPAQKVGLPLNTPTAGKKRKTTASVAKPSLNPPSYPVGTYPAPSYDYSAYYYYPAVAPVPGSDGKTSATHPYPYSTLPNNGPDGKAFPPYPSAGGSHGKLYTYPPVTGTGAKPYSYHPAAGPDGKPYAYPPYSYYDYSVRSAPQEDSTDNATKSVRSKTAQKTLSKPANHPGDQSSMKVATKPYESTKTNLPSNFQWGSSAGPAGTSAGTASSKSNSAPLLFSQNSQGGRDESNTRLGFESIINDEGQWSQMSRVKKMIESGENRAVRPRDIAGDMEKLPVLVTDNDGMSGLSVLNNGTAPSDQVGHSAVHKPSSGSIMSNVLERANNRASKKKGGSVAARRSNGQASTMARQHSLDCPIGGGVHSTPTKPRLQNDQLSPMASLMASLRSPVVGPDGHTKSPGFPAADGALMMRSPGGGMVNMDGFEISNFSTGDGLSRLAMTATGSLSQQGFATNGISFGGTNSLLDTDLEAISALNALSNPPTPSASAPNTPQKVLAGTKRKSGGISLFAKAVGQLGEKEVKEKRGRTG